MILIYLRGLWTVRGIRNYYTIVQVYCISHTVHIQYMFMFKRKYWSEPKRHTEKGTHDTEKDAEKLKKTQSSQRAAAAVCKRFIKKQQKNTPFAARQPFVSAGLPCGGSAAALVACRRGRQQVHSPRVPPGGSPNAQLAGIPPLTTSPSPRTGWHAHLAKTQQSMLH